MADILIRGMSMPEDCGKCVVKYFTPCYEEKHLCPLTELPPHGRLIDADTLSRDFPIRCDRYDREHGDEHFINGIETVIEYVEYMPTILGANETE